MEHKLEIKGLGWVILAITMFVSSVIGQLAFQWLKTLYFLLWRI